MQETEFDRKVLRREYLKLLGWGPTWELELEKRGRIPPAHRDPGGKRRWRRASEIREILATVGNAA